MIAAGHSLTERMIATARSAALCRQHAMDPDASPEMRRALLGAADRYSGLVAELADRYLAGETE